MCTAKTRHTVTIAGNKLEQPPPDTVDPIKVNNDNHFYGVPYVGHYLLNQWTQDQMTQGPSDLSPGTRDLGISGPRDLSWNVGCNNMTT